MVGQVARLMAGRCCVVGPVGRVPSAACKQVESGGDIVGVGVAGGAERFDGGSDHSVACLRRRTVLVSISSGFSHLLSARMAIHLW